MAGDKTSKPAFSKDSLPPQRLPWSLEEGGGTYVTLSQVAKAPVLLYSLEETVVVILGRVSRADLARSQGATEEHSVNLVVLSVATLVVCEDDERAVAVKVGVREERGDPVASPVRAVGEAGVVAVVVYDGERKIISFKHRQSAEKSREVHTHIRGDEDPLREDVVIELVEEQSKVLGFGQAARIARDGLVGHDRAMEQVRTQSREE